MSSKTGVLLLNLGTPNQPTAKEVGKYLKQFLTDPRVIELPGILRKILVNYIIVPRRAKQSAEAYSSIWYKNGSPLLVNSINLQNMLQNKLGDDYLCMLGMRYGNPSIDVAMDNLFANNIDKLIIIPLFPQYASATNGSAIEYVLSILRKKRVILPFNVISDFYQDATYIQALAESIKPYLQENYDRILFSYHGLPARQIKGLGKHCYREKCFTTSTLTAEYLGLSAEQWEISFQSRLGKLEWIKPYTDDMLIKLAKDNVRRLLVVCPSFVADCLETLEEIGIRASEQWLELGGEQLHLVPCLNDSKYLIASLANMITN